MKGTLFIVPVSLAVFLAGSELLPADQLVTYHGLFGGLALLWAGFASVRAGAGFECGQLLRLAWMANGLSLSLSAPIVLGPTFFGGMPLVVTRLVLTILANVTGIVSIWTFGRAYREAGLDFGATRLRQALIVVGGLVAGSLLAGSALLRSLRELAGGDLDSLTLSIASAGDIVMFALLVPVFTAVIRLRGGLLAWPWSYFFASNLFWLVSDLQGSYAPSWVDPWLVAAATASVAAGFAQRRISDNEAS